MTPNKTLDKMPDEALNQVVSSYDGTQIKSESNPKAEPDAPLAAIQPATETKPAYESEFNSLIEQDNISFGITAEPKKATTMEIQWGGFDSHRFDDR